MFGLQVSATGFLVQVLTCSENTRKRARDRRKPAVFGVEGYGKRGGLLAAADPLSTAAALNLGLNGDELRAASHSLFRGETGAREEVMRIG